MTYTSAQYREMTGHDPEQDDLERLNCEQAGKAGHSQCGYCPEHHKPRFLCMCMLFNGRVSRPQ